MLNPAQAQLISKLLNDTISRNNVRSETAVRMYRSIEQMPPDTKYEYDQRETETAALVVLVENLPKITSPA